MQPNTPLGQLSQSMQAGTPELLQQTGGSPNFSPSLQPPSASPMPEKSPMSGIHGTALHRALQRRGLPIPPQLQPGGANVQIDPQTGRQAFPKDILNPQPGEPGTNDALPISEVETIVNALTKHLGHKAKQESKILDAALSMLPQQDMQFDASGREVLPKDILNPQGS